MSLQTWQISLDSLLDFSAPNPFNQPNATHAQMKIMNWATHLTGTVPYSLPRGMVFQGGKRLIHLAHWDDLFRVDGAFWVDTLRNMLHVNPMGYVKPEEADLSLTALEQLFRPVNIASSYIKIKGLTFECAGNGFMRTGVGAVFNNGGNHWIIEDNVIRKVNSVGLEIGTKFTEDRKPSKKEQEAIQKNRGGMIVRGNEIYDCGTGGIQGLRNFDALVTENHLHHIGWQDAEFYWECAAVKLLVNRRTLVQKNRIHDVASANAIWLDWDNINSRITSNLIYDIYPASGGAIYIEASRKTPNWIDHNILWNVTEIGISVYDSDSIQTFNNLIANTGLPYISRVNTKGRKVDGRLLTSVANIMTNNILYENEQLPKREDMSNKAFDNVFVDENFDAFLAQNWGRGNTRVLLSITFSPVSLQMDWGGSVPTNSKSPYQVPDIRGYTPLETSSSPGPFQTMGKGKLTFDLGRLFPFGVGK